MGEYPIIGIPRTPRTSRQCIAEGFRGPQLGPQYDERRAPLTCLMTEIQVRAAWVRFSAAFGASKSYPNFLNPFPRFPSVFHEENPKPPRFPQQNFRFSQQNGGFVTVGNSETGQIFYQVFLT